MSFSREHPLIPIIREGARGVQSAHRKGVVRAYCQALADAGVNAQQAKALAGHATEQAHERYLRASKKARELPAPARPPGRPAEGPAQAASPEGSSRGGNRNSE
jgi:hypothetical protein